MSVLRAVLAFAVVCAALDSAPIPQALLFNALPPLHDHPLALCNDGSPAALYYRNCSANWDSKSGFDYCANITKRFIIFFASTDIRPALANAAEPPAAPSRPSGAYCYDLPSCAARSPNLTTSRGLPPTAFFGGFLSPYAEVSPNFYKSSMAVIPYCSSDLFAGNATHITPSGAPLHFRGSAIFDAAIASLLRLSPPSASLAAADEVIIVGPAGVMDRLPALRATLAASAQPRAPPRLFGVCDGCLLLPGLPPPPDAPPGCTTDANCPPSAGLRAASALWAASGGVAPPWPRLAAPALLKSLSAAGLPLLVVAQQRDAVQLSAHGAWREGAAAAGWARSVYAPALKAALAAGLPSPPLGAAFASAPCAWPPGLALSQQGWYDEVGACVDGAGRARNDSAAQVAGALVDCNEAGVPADFCVTCPGADAGVGGCPFSDPW